MVAYYFREFLDLGRQGISIAIIQLSQAQKELQVTSMARLALLRTQTSQTQSELAQENIRGRNSILEEAVKKGEFTAQQALAMMGMGGVNMPQQQPTETMPTPQREEAQIPAGQDGI